MGIRKKNLQSGSQDKEWNWESKLKCTSGKKDAVNVFIGNFVAVLFSKATGHLKIGSFST